MIFIDIKGSLCDNVIHGILINAENAASHKYVVQNGRSMFRAISESVGNSVLIPSQNSFKFMRGCSGLLISADKTGNLYNISEESYLGLVTNELNKDYNVCDVGKLNSINGEGLKIVQAYDLGDRTEPYRPGSRG